MITVCVNNAWIFAREGCYKDDLLSFMHAVATEWLQNHGRKPRNPGKSQSVISAASVFAQTNYDNIGHHIVKKNPSKRSRCKLCNTHTIYVLMSEMCSTLASKVFSRVSYHVSRNNPEKIYPSFILIRMCINFFYEQINHVFSLPLSRSLS